MRSSLGKLPAAFAPKPRPGQPTAAAATVPGAAPVNDGRKTYAPGELLFQQGDPGGDLFFIESGLIEIFTQREGEAVILAEMAQGEIIGIMTCLTSEQRMASARAKTHVVCKRVPHDSVKKVLAALPNWMKIVLKEFTIRLAGMNKAFSEATVRVKALEENQISHVYLGALVASAFGTVADFMAIKYEDTKIVVIEDLLVKLEFVLNMKREDIDRVYNVLLDAGLIKQEIEPERKRNIVKLDNAQKLSHFAQFVRESKHGPTKRLVRARFTHKETRVLSAIVKLTQRLGMDLEKNCRLPAKELEKSLERSTGVKFEMEALTKAAKLKLLSFEGQENDMQVVFRPSLLGRTVACVEAVRKLGALDHPEAEEPAAKPQVKAS